MMTHDGLSSASVLYLLIQVVQLRRQQQEQDAAIKIQSVGRMKIGRDEVGVYVLRAQIHGGMD